jgi:hypothetical protein
LAAAIDLRDGLLPHSEKKAVEAIAGAKSAFEMRNFRTKLA